MKSKDLRSIGLSLDQGYPANSQKSSQLFTTTKALELQAVLKDVRLTSEQCCSLTEEPWSYSFSAVLTILQGVPFQAQPL